MHASHHLNSLEEINALWHLCDSQQEQLDSLRALGIRLPAKGRVLEPYIWRWQKEERVNAALPLYRVYFLIRGHLRERTGHQRRVVERKEQS
jgi:hypothetical protein